MKNVSVVFADIYVGSNVVEDVLPLLEMDDHVKSTKRPFGRPPPFVFAKTQGHMKMVTTTFMWLLANHPMEEIRLTLLEVKGCDDLVSKVLAIIANVWISSSVSDKVDLTNIATI